jgi:hypothetical protein
METELMSPIPAKRWAWVREMEKISRSPFASTNSRPLYATMGVSFWVNPPLPVGVDVFVPASEERVLFLEVKFLFIFNIHGAP